MWKIKFASALFAAIGLLGTDGEVAQANTAWGLSIGGPAVRLNVGSYDPYYYGASPQLGYRRPYSDPRWYGYDQRDAYRRYETRRYDVRRYAYVPVRSERRDDFCRQGPRGYDPRRIDPRRDDPRRDDRFPGHGRDGRGPRDGRDGRRR